MWVKHNYGQHKHIKKETNIILSTDWGALSPGKGWCSAIKVLQCVLHSFTLERVTVHSPNLLCSHLITVNRPIPAGLTQRAPAHKASRQWEAITKREDTLYCDIQLRGGTTTTTTASLCVSDWVSKTIKEQDQRENVGYKKRINADTQMH